MANRFWDSYNQNNRNYGTGGDNPFVPIAQQAQANTWGGIQDASQFANGLEAQRENNLNQQLGFLSQGGIDAAKNQTLNGIWQNAATAANQGAASLKGLGFGDGAGGGILAAMLGQGQTQANQAVQHFSDPSYISSVLQRAYGVIGQGMQNPLAQQAMGYEPYITQQNATNFSQRGQGLLGSISPILGSLAGQFTGSSLFGGSTTNPFITDGSQLGNYRANQYLFDNGYFS
jgi:hypothetical protein